MLLMLLVHNSLAFPGMYEDIDGECFRIKRIINMEDDILFIDVHFQ